MKFKPMKRFAFTTALFSIALFGVNSAFAQKSSPPPSDSTGTPGWNSQDTQGPTSRSPRGPDTQGLTPRSSQGTTASQGTTSRSTGSEAMDETFVKKAAAGGIAEVKLGQLAQEKGSSSAVKEFGKRMENDHSKAGEQLKTAASKDNIPVPEEMDKKDQATYDHLSKLSGAEFDRVYAQHMVTDHEKDIEEFRKEASTGKNPDVKNFASKTLPTLQDHLRQAREMEKSVSARESSKNSQ